MDSTSNSLKLVRLGIDTQQELIVFVPANCFIYKSEGFEAATQIVVSLNNHSIVATLNIVHSTILKGCEASLSESAWERLGAVEGDYSIITFSTINLIRLCAFQNTWKPAQRERIQSDH